MTLLTSIGNTHVAALSHHELSAVAWGTVPDWILAIGTLALFIAAFITIMQDRKRVEALEAEHRRQRKETSLERASQVSAWPEDWSSNDVRVTCHNGCAEPIYNVVIRVAEGNPVVPPDLTEYDDTKAAFLMKPGENLEAILRLRCPPSSQPRIDLAFRDTRGNRWWRRADGIVVPVSYSDPEAQIGESKK